MTDKRTVSAADRTRSRHPDGPNLGALAIVHGVLVLLAIGVGAALAGGDLPASPLSDAAGTVEYLRDHAAAAQVAAWLQFGAAVPLLIFAATGYSRQSRLGLRVPGPVISLAGGIFASAMLALSSLAVWVAAFEDIPADADLAHALMLFAFAAGGIGFATGVGLLVAGLAVPALILRFVPRWLAAVGLLIAACGELSFITLIATPFAVLIPIVRFASVAWLIAIGFLLPKRRSAANAASRARSKTGRGTDLPGVPGTSGI